MPTTASTSIMPPGGPSQPRYAGSLRPASAFGRSDADTVAPSTGAGAFSSLLDGIAALGRIPVVGTLYRTVTLQDVRPALRVLGGFATGGAPGAVASAVSVIADEVNSQPAAVPSDSPGPTAVRSPMSRLRSAVTTDLEAMPAAGIGTDGDLARRLQVGLAAYDRTRSQSEHALMPAPGSLVAQAGRAAA